jgi:hypothetical protein
MGLGLLHKINISDTFMRDLWAKAVSPGTPRLRACPHCGQNMAEVINDVGGKPLTLDVCTSCQSV